MVGAEEAALEELGQRPQLARPRIPADQSGQVEQVILIAVALEAIGWRTQTEVALEETLSCPGLNRMSATDDIGRGIREDGFRRRLHDRLA